MIVYYDNDMFTALHSYVALHALLHQYSVQDMHVHNYIYVYIK